MIEERTRKVFYSQTANRHYFTKLAAIKAEARALLIKKHPTEAAESEPEIGHYYPGWHWTELERSDVLYRRVVRMVKNASSPNVKLRGATLHQRPARTESYAILKENEDAKL